MGYYASAGLTYGYDVTAQRPAWWDRAWDNSDPGVYASMVLVGADLDGGVSLAYDERTGTTILAAATHHAWQDEGPTEIDSLVLPDDVADRLSRAAATLGYDLAGLTPAWSLTAHFG